MKVENLSPCCCGVQAGKTAYLQYLTRLVNFFPRVLCDLSCFGYWNSMFYKSVHYTIAKYKHSVRQNICIDKCLPNDRDTFIAPINLLYIMFVCSRRLKKARIQRTRCVTSHTPTLLLDRVGFDMVISIVISIYLRDKPLRIGHCVHSLRTE